jgi:hypothetical protein
MNSLLYKPLTGHESLFKRILMDESGPYLFTSIYFLFTRRIAGRIRGGVITNKIITRTALF